MSEQTENNTSAAESPATVPTGGASTSSPPQRRATWKLAAVATAIFVAGTAVGGVGMGAVEAWAAGGFGGWHHGHGQGHSPAEVKERIADKVAWVLGRVDASEAQEAAVTDIMHGAADELFPLVAEHRANRGKLLALLGAESLDMQALEALRKTELALLDEGTLVLTRAVGDSAEVLSPAQRTQLAAAVRRFRRH